MSINGITLFQQRAKDWALKCFNGDTVYSRQERNHRFLEEALELVQSLGCTRYEAHQLLDYVYDKPDGEPIQEVGGVFLTLSVLCSAHDINLSDAAFAEMQRVERPEMIERIRAKQATKPKHSPLPGTAPGDSYLARVREAHNTYREKEPTMKEPTKTGPEAKVLGVPLKNWIWINTGIGTAAGLLVLYIFG